jgi:hypothetical protein
MSHLKTLAAAVDNALLNLCVLVEEDYGGPDQIDAIREALLEALEPYVELAQAIQFGEEEAAFCAAIKQKRSGSYWSYRS